MKVIFIIPSQNAISTFIQSNVYILYGFGIYIGGWCNAALC